MRKYEVKPDITRTTIGYISVLSFLLGMYFCDLAMTHGSPSWTADATFWCLIVFFVSFLLWRLMRIQDDNI